MENSERNGASRVLHAATELTGTRPGDPVVGHPALAAASAELQNAAVAEATANSTSKLVAFARDLGEGGGLDAPSAAPPPDAGSDFGDAAGPQPAPPDRGPDLATRPPPSSGQAPMAERSAQPVQAEGQPAAVAPITALPPRQSGTGDPPPVASAPAAQDADPTEPAARTAPANDPAPPHTLTTAATEPSIERQATVADRAEAPTAVAVTGGSVAEDAAAGTVVATLAAQDADAGDAHGYEIVGGSALFEIAGNEIRLRPGASLDHETAPSHTLTVRATDSTGLAVERQVTIAVADRAEAPTAISIAAQRDFIVNGGFEQTSLTIADGAWAPVATMAGWQLVAGPQLEPHATGNRGVAAHEGRIWLDMDASPGNVAIRQTLVGLQDGEAYTLTFSAAGTAGRADNGVEVWWNGARAATVETPASPDWITHSITLASAPGEGQDLLEFRGTGPADNIGVALDAIRVVGATATPTIAETAAAGTVVATLAAQDADAGDAHGYEIVGGSALFEIAGNEIRLRPGASLDHETAPSHTLTVRATDSTGLAVERQVTIAVTPDANDAPTSIALSASSANERLDPGSIIATLSTADPDRGETHSYTLVSDPSGMFEIRGAQLALRWGQALDREVAASHAVVLRSTDAAGAWIERSFTIAVTDAGELQVTGNGSANRLNTSGHAADMRGGGGNDTVLGHSGRDRLWGEEGNDSLHGHHGNDLLWGGNGNDTLDGHQDDDILWGGAGNDRLHGHQGADTLFGEAGNDTLDGHNDRDLMQGGLGNDSLHGGDGADTLMGDDGNDTLAGHNDADLLQGGNGNDRLTGDNGADTLQGGEGNDTLSGGTDHDRLEGGAGADSLHGGSGEDWFDPGTGRDTIVGDTGHDTLAISPDGLSDRFLGGDGLDMVAMGAGAGQRDAPGGWLLQLTQGSQTGSGQGFLTLSNGADGRIVFADGSVLDFQDVERLTWQQVA